MAKYINRVTIGYLQLEYNQEILKDKWNQLTKQLS